MSNASKESGKRSIAKVVGSRLLVKKLVTGRKSEIILPKATIQKQFIGIIKKVGKDVRDKETLTEDRIVFVDNNAGEKGLNDGEFFFKQDDVLLVKKDGLFRPMGNKVLIKRMNNTEVSIGGIIIPMGRKSSDQTLFGVVFALGVSNNNTIDTTLNVGDIIKLQKWDVSMRDVSIDDENYIISPIKHVELSCNEEFVSENFVKKV